VRNAILAALADEKGQAVPHLIEFVPLVIAHGIEHDSDAVFVTRPEDDHLHCGLVVGCTLLVGTAIREFLEQYHAFDKDQIAETVNWLIAVVEDGVETGHMGFFPLQGDDQKWRSFRGERLPSYSEVFAKTRRDQN
jgi:hypothetical protein